jgi:signal transduction histidine kinase
VLQFSRAERAPARLRLERVELGPLARDVAEAFALLARARSAEVRVAVPAGVEVAADRDALRQVLLNLLDNAAKYGPPGQTITVGAARAGDGVRLWVEDEGPGIPRGERERVWRPFERLERDVQDGPAGNGIGLSVVRDLVRLHDGATAIEDAAGGGARVVVLLPVLPRRAAPPPSGGLPRRTASVPQPA